MATSRTRKTIVNEPVQEQVHAAPPPTEAEVKEFFAKIQGDWAYLIKGDASWKRFAAASIASLAASAGVSWMGGYVVALLTIAAAGTGSLFIATCVWLLGVLSVMYAGYRAGMFTYVKVIDGTVDRVVLGAYHKVRGYFGYV